MNLISTYNDTCHFQSFNLLDDDASYEGCLITEVRLTGDDQATVQVKHGRHTHELRVAAGTSHAASPASGHYVNTHYHDQLLADMMESHMVKDFCIIGPRVSRNGLLTITSI